MEGERYQLRRGSTDTLRAVTIRSDRLCAFRVRAVIAACASLSAVGAAFAGAADCPKGGDYRTTLPDLAGACAVAFHEADLIVCVPDALSQTEQVLRISRLADETPVVTAFRVNVDQAVDVAVSADGTIAVADAAGAVWVGGEAPVPADGSATRVEEWKLLVRDASMRPSGIAWIGDRIAVSDARSGEIVLVSTAGDVVSRLGRGVLGDPRGLAAAADGTIFVADHMRDCLWRFDRAADGSYTAPPKRLAEPGFNPGQLSSPSDVFVLEKDGARCLLVADELNHRAHVLTPEGVFVGFFGMHALVPRMGEGRIHYPRSIAVAADGVTLAVAEAFEDRVQLFGLNAEADPVDASANRAEFISSHFGSDAACAADLLVVHDLETESLAVCDARTTPPIHMSIIGGGGALPQRLGEVSAVGVEPETGRVWVADRAHARIDVFDVVWDRTQAPVIDLFMPRLARSMDLARLSRGTDRRAPEISDILFVKGDAGLEVWLLDRANRGIHRADLRLTPKATDAWIALPDEARSPEELARAADGRIAVADPVVRSVFMREPTGAWTALRELGWDFVRPSGVEFDERGQLVVSDAALDSVLVSDPQGARRVGERGILDEQFYDPQSILPSP